MRSGRVVGWSFGVFPPPVLCFALGFGHNNFESSLCRALCPPFHSRSMRGSLRVFFAKISISSCPGFSEVSAPVYFPDFDPPGFVSPHYLRSLRGWGFFSVLIFWRGSQVTRWVWEGRARVLRFLGAGRPFGPASLGGLRVRVPLRAEERPPAWGSPGLWPSGVWVVGSAGLVCPVLVWHTPFTSA